MVADMDVTSYPSDRMDEGRTDSYLLARFLTKTPRFAVPDITYSLVSSTTSADLSNLINQLLKEKGSGDEAALEAIEFDFLVNTEVLIESVGEFVQRHSISAEDVITIEYVERLAAPEPDKSLPHLDWVSAVDSSQGFILTGSYDNSARIFSDSGALLVETLAHTAPIKAVAWVEATKDSGLFLTASHDQTVALWRWQNVPNGKQRHINAQAIYRGHAASVDGLSLSPDRKNFCSVSWDKMLKIWSLEDNEENTIDDGERPEKRQKVDGKKLTRVPVTTLSGHKEAVSSCVWTSANEIMTASMDRTIRIWDVELGGMSREMDASKATLTLAYSPLNKLLITGATDRIVRLYDPRSNEGAIIKMAFTSHNGWVPAVSWSPTSQYHFISGSYDKLMKMWDTRNPKCPLYDMTGHSDKILCAAWANSNLLLSGGADKQLKVFRASV